MNGNRIQMIRPWNIVNEPTGPSTPYPFDFFPPEGNNDNLIAKWYAVQKNWKISGEVTLTDGEGDHEYTFEVTNPSRALNAVDGNERSLIRGIYGFWMSQDFPSDTPDSPDLRVVVAIGAYDENTSAPAGGIEGSPLAPLVVVQLFAENEIGRGVSTNELTLPTDLTGTVSGYSPAFFGDINRYAYAGTITIEPPASDGYFEFRDANGLNPVFDKDSGAQLITPAPTR